MKDLQVGDTFTCSHGTGVIVETQPLVDDTGVNVLFEHLDKALWLKASDASAVKAKKDMK